MSALGRKRAAPGAAGAPPILMVGEANKKRLPIDDCRLTIGCEKGRQGKRKAKKLSAKIDFWGTKPSTY